MSVILRPKATCYPMHTMGIRPRTGRGFAGLVTGGALALALVLAVAIPVRAAPTAIATGLNDAVTGTLDH